jgi:hypothetical protein
LISSNIKNIPLIPFNCDFVYVTLECKDQQFLDEVTLCIKATIQTNQYKKKHKGPDQPDYVEIDTSSLTEYYNQEKPPKNIKKNMMAFKQNKLD